MKKSDFKQLIREQLYKSMINPLYEETNPESGLSGAAHLSVGTRTTRIVIDGDDMENKADKILDILKRQDKNNTIQFFPNTGKLVGQIAKSRLDAIKRDLKPFNVKISEKAQTKSLKKI
jgi:hypothetical protein